MVFTIEKSIFKDLPNAHRLDRIAFGVDCWCYLDFLLLFDDADARCFTAKVKGQFAGFATAIREYPYQSACIATLAVEEKFRRMGIASGLLRFCESCWPNLKYTLCVDENNLPGIRLYEKSGYRLSGFYHAYYASGHNALCMEKPARNNLSEEVCIDKV